MKRRLALAAAAALLVAWPPLTLAAVITQKQGVRLSVDARLTPSRLPRRGAAPVAFSVAGHIASTSPNGPPQLRTITIAINAHGHLTTRGLPLCRLGHISPSTNREALSECADSLVGEGHFSADVKIPEQSPFPSEGKVLAFNGRLRGKPAILAHIYGREPVPTSYVMTFLIKRARGTYGTVLETSLPHVTGEWGYVTGISLHLERVFTSHGAQRSYLTAACPAPAGAPQVGFPLMRAGFDFAGGLRLTSVLNSSCTVLR